MLRGHAEPRRFSLGSTGSAVQILRGPERQAGGSTPPPERDEAGDEQGAEQGTHRNARTWGFERACLLEVLTCCTISFPSLCNMKLFIFSICFFLSTPESIPRMMSSVSLQKDSDMSSSIRGEYMKGFFPCYSSNADSHRTSRRTCIEHEPTSLAHCLAEVMILVLQ